jgi:hypothetical protein
VEESIVDWQVAGLVPDMRTEPGDETARLIHERGWSRWHHLFTPRQLLCQSALNSFQVTASKSFHVVKLLLVVSAAA